MSSGTVIFLNGTSSAGKTTLAHELQERLPVPYQHIALDQFRDGLPAQYRGLNSPAGRPGQLGLNVVPVASINNDQGNASTKKHDAKKIYTRIKFGTAGKQMLQGMRRGIKAMAQAGNNVIIDDIILDPEFLVDYLDVLRHITVYFVGVRCPIETINQREARRPGRFPGTAAGHFETCHRHDCYDIEVDTSRLSPEQCAARVIARLKEGPPRAFPALNKRAADGAAP